MAAMLFEIQKEELVKIEQKKKETRAKFSHRRNRNSIHYWIGFFCISTVNWSKKEIPVNANKTK